MNIKIRTQEIIDSLNMYINIYEEDAFYGYLHALQDCNVIDDVLREEIRTCFEKGIPLVSLPMLED